MSNTDIPTLSIEGLQTYLHCPRRYEFAHVHGLESDDEQSRSTADRIDLLRTAICDALRESERERFEDRANQRFSELWNTHDEHFHSRAQRRHERAVLEATLEAYVDRVGAAHMEGLDELEAETTAELVGPRLPLSSTRTLPETSATDAERVRIDSSVDYVYRDGSSIVGVRFVPTLAPLGLLRYRSEWEGDIASLFIDHFDSDTEVFEPQVVGALFETAAVLDGLRELRDRLGLAGQTCRYVQIPLIDRSNTVVNWVQNTVETTLEPIDLTDVYIDHHTYGMTHEHRNETIDSRLETVAGNLVAGAFDPTDQWERIETDSCPDCGYTVCCQEHIAAEVRFDG